jgi:hypothetical protein
VKQDTLLAVFIGWMVLIIFMAFIFKENKATWAKRETHHLPAYKNFKQSLDAGQTVLDVP